MEAWNGGMLEDWNVGVKSDNRRIFQPSNSARENLSTIIAAPFLTC
jgi:hypothetical protein